MVHQVSCSLKSIILENLGIMHVKEYDTSNLKKMLILSLRNLIYLRSSRTSGLMKDAMLREERGKSSRRIFSTIIQIKNFELNVKLSFDQFVK